MPKRGLSVAEWRQRLQSYARGDFEFTRGQRPGKSNRWASDALKKIECCPKHLNPTSCNPLGRRIECTCGYHAALPLTSAQSSSQSASPATHSISQPPSPAAHSISQPPSPAAHSISQPPTPAEIQPQPSLLSQPPTRPSPLSRPLSPAATQASPLSLTPAATQASPLSRPLSPAAIQASRLSHPLTPAATQASPLSRPLTPAATQASRLSRPLTPAATQASRLSRPLSPAAIQASRLSRPLSPAAIQASRLSRPLTPAATQASPLSRPLTPTARPLIPASRPPQYARPPTPTAKSPTTYRPCIPTTRPSRNGRLPTPADRPPPPSRPPTPAVSLPLLSQPPTPAVRPPLPSQPPTPAASLSPLSQPPTPAASLSPLSQPPTPAVRPPLPSQPPTPAGSPPPLSQPPTPAVRLPLPSQPPTPAVSSPTPSQPPTSQAIQSSEDEPQPKRVCHGEPGSLGLVKRRMDHGKKLPQGWEKNVAAADREWIGQALFRKKGELVAELKKWWHPPEVNRLSSTKPSPAAYHLQRLFLWMPRRMWKVDFHCPICTGRPSLRSKGLYNRVRLVLDLRDQYYLAGEYMYCAECKGTFLSWDHRILEQLADGTRECFPVLLTHKHACDRSVVTLLRGRTLGNSPTALRRNLHEVHSEEWLRKQLCYLSDCERYRRGLLNLHLVVPPYEEAAPFPHFLTPRWFLSLYVRDVWSRLPSLLASATSIFGSILKIDSTKKVCKKLQGAAANTAAWVTNVGNERGEVVQSIVTASEGTPSLVRLADGLVERYAKAAQPPPRLLYTDRDCCAAKFVELFARWGGLVVRLDIWHYMRRLAGGCTTESHPLYGTFMKQLSSCIFEWDMQDVELLISAKRGELVSAGILSPSDAALRKAISKEELARHCRRRTRGAEKTVDLVEALLLSLSSATDTLGVPLLREEMRDIWEEQKRHVTCIQDPPGIQLYTITGHLTKGGVRLPVLRCARGSTSLESFHLHLARFIPGTSASAIHFQAYLLDGITRWNAARASAAIHTPVHPTLRTFDVRLQGRVNVLTHSLHGSAVFPHYRPPAAYTGELFGVEYLYAQCGFSYSTELEGHEGDDGDADEGFQEEEELLAEPLVAEMEEEPVTPLPPAGDESEDEEEEEPSVEDGAVDARGIPGWERVDALARALLKLSGLSVSASQASEIQQLYNGLLEFDKKPLTFAPRLHKPTKGRFARSKQRRLGHVDVETMKRCFLSAGSPASSPSKSRLVEAICLHLCDQITQPQKEAGLRGRVVYTSRWRQVLSAYNNVRARLLNSEALLEGTNLQLYTINEATLVRWYKDTVRRDEVKILLQGLTLQRHIPCAAASLPPPLKLPSSPSPPPEHSHIFPEPEDTVGRARVRGSAATRLVRGCTATRLSRGYAATHLASAQLTSAGTFSTSLLSSLLSPASSSGTSSISLSASDPTAAASVPPPDAVITTPGPVSKTTQWRWRVKGEIDGGKERKNYTCRICNKPMVGTGHTQFRGQRYCPSAPGQIPREEWLIKKKEEAAAKKMS